MKHRQLAIAVPFALFFASLAVRGQAPASKGQPLYREAARLHLEKKYADAAGKMKSAAALEPGNQSFAAYRAELDALAAQDRFDSHALHAPAQVEKTVETLAAYLVKPAKTDRDKVRLIWCWITDRIAYDTDSFFAGKAPSTRAETTLKNRKALCGGYAELFTRLGKLAGLEVVEIRGLAKGYGFAAGGRHEKHAWNAVKLDGQWQLLDSTWGAGSTVNRKFEKIHKEHYFLTPPEKLIFTHRPDDPKWQLLNPPVPREEFLTWARADRHLFQYGVAAADLRVRVKQGPVVKTPKIPPMKLTLHAAPLEAKLKAGTKHRFRIESAGFEDIRVFTGGKAIRLPKKGTLFEGVVEAKPGQLAVGARPPSEAKKFHFLLIYMVE